MATATDPTTAGRVRVTVVTPEKAAFDGAAEFVVLPMYDGELGVLPERAPLIGRLGAGELRLTSGGRTTARFFVESGFVQVRNNVVTVLTARAVKAADVTQAAADKAAADADALPNTTPVERAAREKAQARAAGLKRVAAKNAGGAA